MGGKLAKPKTHSVLFVGLDNAGKSTILSWKERRVTGSPIDGDGDRCICPTIGVDLKEFQDYGVRWRVWDMPGHGRYRYLWQFYTKQTQAIVFVIDTQDHDRLSIAKEELQNTLSQLGFLNRNNRRLRQFALLVFANKVGEPQKLQQVTGQKIAKKSRKIDEDEDGDEENKDEEDLQERKEDSDGIYPTGKGEDTSVVDLQFVSQLLQIDILKAKYRIDIKVKECNGLTGKGIEEGFQWLHEALGKHARASRPARNE